MKLGDIDDFMLACNHAALWSSNCGDHEGLEEFDFAPEAYQFLAKVAREFFEANEALILGEGNYIRATGGSPQAAMAGHDFWLTAVGHGAGFWDGDWKEDVGKALTTAAEQVGNMDLYLGDDNLVYVV